MRIERAVQRLDGRLEGRVPWRRRRQIRDDLRANLAIAARDNGAEAAVEQLGDIRDLADAYLEGERGSLNLRRGAIAVIATFTALNLANVLIFVAYRAGFEEAGGEGAWKYSWELIDGLGPFVGSGSNQKMFDIYFLSPVHLLLMLLTGVVFSGAWRLPLRLVRGDSEGD